MFHSVFNYIESVFWIIISLILFLKTRGKIKVKPEVRYIAVISFFLFGISDIIEVQSGAWWTPWWLLLLKFICILSFIFCFVQYKKSIS